MKRRLLKPWIVTWSRHHDALVFALSVQWGGHKYNSRVGGWTATIGLGLWSLHVAYRWLLEASDD